MSPRAPAVRLALEACLIVAACIGLLACGERAESMHDANVEDAGDAESPIRVDAARPFAQYVNPFVGTGGEGFSFGATFPGPTRPFGLARPSPDTRDRFGSASFHHYGGYYATDEWITGFSHLHLHGAGIVDYGVLSLMPANGISEDKARRDGATAKKVEGSEVARPGFYGVDLDSGVRVELTATPRGAAHRWTFAQESTPAAMIDLAHAIARGEPGGVEIDDATVRIIPEAREVEGSVHFLGSYSERFGGMTVYFVARFDAPFRSYAVFDNGALLRDETTRQGDNVGAIVELETGSARTAEARIGISFVDLAGARANLDSELDGVRFDDLVTDAHEEWEERLGIVSVEGARADDLVRFYTALYHSLIAPTRADDVDGRYRGFDGEVHQGHGFRYFTDFSLWDTFRTLHPLAVLLFPDDARDFLKSLVQMGRDGGYIDRWPLGIGYTGGMVGESATLLFADAIVKQLDDVPYREAFDLLASTARTRPPEGARYDGRGGLEDYLALGYVTTETSGSASLTLEYAYNDWALARIADALELDPERAEFEARSGSWRNLYDETTGYLRGRARDGSFEAAFDEHLWTAEFVEGNAAHYQWYVPHDLGGLASTMGGDQAFLTRLQTFFEASERARRIPLFPDENYWHGNEPDIHASWIFAWFADTERSSRWVRWVADTRYTAGVDGLPGNDDGGTLSAWLVWSMLGLYPFPGEDDYALAAPAFERAVVRLGEAQLVIEAPGWTNAQAVGPRFILDGEGIPSGRVPHERLREGGTLRCEFSE